LWKAFDEGDARLDEALKIVAAAHALARTVAATANVAEPGALSTARAKLRNDEGSGLSDDAREALRRAEEHLRFHFGRKG
jgi:hypothetical protein